MFLAKILPKRFYQLSSQTYWLDFALSVAFFYFFLVAGFSLSLGFTFLPLAALAAYRVSAFIHELNHAAYKIHGLREGYLAFFGLFFMVLPSDYVNHSEHHRVHDFGTQNDEKFKKSIFNRYYLYFFNPVIAPFFNFSNQLIKTFKGDHRQQRMASIVFFLFALVIFKEIFLITYFLVHFSIELLDSIHLNCTHVYGDRLCDSAYIYQIKSSKNVLGPFSFIFMPIGLNFHRLHHAAPGIPYHNLAAAHEYLLKTLPENHVYLK